MIRYSISSIAQYNLLSTDSIDWGLDNEKCYSTYETAAI